MIVYELRMYMAIMPFLNMKFVLSLLDEPFRSLAQTCSYQTWHCSFNHFARYQGHLVVPSDRDELFRNLNMVGVS